MDIQQVVNKFVVDLTKVVEQNVKHGILAKLDGMPAGKLNGKLNGKSNGKPNGKSSSFVVVKTKAGVVTRRKAAPQLCPVPGCKNRAAPIFGMVCGDHRKVPKAKIKAYRAARKAKK